jgi:glutathione-independent formaldehyde dehydrogenase
VIARRAQNVSLRVMSGQLHNRGVVYLGPGRVEVQGIAYPKLYLDAQKRPCEHGVILKVIGSCICGSDVHMFRGRTTAQAGIVFGHEITGEVIERGRDVEFIAVGSIVSIPFNSECRSAAL